MNKSSLTADDLPPKVTLRDELLLRRLEEAIGKHFYQAGDSDHASFVIRHLQKLIMRCLQPL